jgi:hypothetical protein
MYAEEDEPYGGSLIIEDASANYPGEARKKMGIIIEWKMKGGDMPPLRKYIEVDAGELFKVLRIFTE